MIILNEKDDHYEIVDGRQQLTTDLLTFAPLYNSYKGQRREQSKVLSYIRRSTDELVIENESIGDHYLSISNEISLNIPETDDIHFQEYDFE